MQNMFFNLCINSHAPSWVILECESWWGHGWKKHSFCRKHWLFADLKWLSIKCKQLLEYRFFEVLINSNVSSRPGLPRMKKSCVTYCYSIRFQRRIWILNKIFAPRSGYFTLSCYFLLNWRLNIYFRLDADALNGKIESNFFSSHLEIKT